MNWIKEKFINLPDKERKQLLMLLLFGFLAGYSFYAAHLWKEMFHVEKMANRKADRIEKRIGDFKAPELEDGVSHQALKKLKQLKNEQETRLKGFTVDLMPLGDAAAREELKLAITQLAYSNHLRLSALKASELRESLQVAELTSQKLRDYLQKRPTFSLVLSGQFLNLVNFVDSLDQLNYQVYISDLEVELVNAENSLLKIEMQLRI